MKLVVDVVDEKGEAVSNARVTFAPDGGTPVEVETKDDGKAVTSIPIPAAKWSEGWLSSAPTIKISASNGSLIGSTTITLRSKDFKGASQIELNRDLTLRPASVSADVQSVALTVQVTDDAGKALPGTRVNVYQERRGSVAAGIVVPPDYQQETGAGGFARLTVNVKKGQSFGVTIEVAREDMETETRPLDLGTNFSTRLPPEKFALKRKLETGSGPIVNVAIDVQDQESKPVEGATVGIWDSELGPSLGRFRGTTGADGRAIVPIRFGGGMLHMEAAKKHKVEVTVTKAGYKEKRQFHAVTQNDIGKTSLAGAVILEKEVSGGGAKVTVTVIDKSNRNGVVDAAVILDGASYHSDTTNGAGIATFIVSNIGTFQVRVSQDNYKPSSDEIRLLAGEKEKPLTLELEPKAKKDLGEDKIEITVLAKDPTDEKSKPAPLAGALVKAGTISASTDPNGNALLEAAFEEKQEVTVTANGYKLQSKTVAVAKFLHYSRGSGKATFTLDPELSENSPIRLVIEVLGPKGPIQGADVDFLLPSGEPLWGKATDKNGKCDFRNSDKPSVPLAELRKGIVINVKKKEGGYKEVLNRFVDLSQPSLEARLFTVQLEQSWDDLRKAIEALEPKVLAWHKETAAAPQAAETNRLLGEMTKISNRVSATREELDSAHKAFFGPNAEPVSTLRCKEAARLKDDIERYGKQAGEKEQELKKALDEAIAMVARCSTPADAGTIKKLYDHAIKLTGEIGALEKKAAKDGTALRDSINQQKDFKKITAALEAVVAELKADAIKAEGISSSAEQTSAREGKPNPSLTTRRDALSAELGTLKKTHGLEKSREGVPADLLRRIDAMAGLLGKWTADSAILLGKPARDSLQAIKEAAGQVGATKEKGEALLAAYKRGICQIEPMDAAVEAIGSIVTSAMIELAAAADLPKQADACAARLAAAAAKTPSSYDPNLIPQAVAEKPAAANPPPPPPSDEIIVPDVSRFDDPMAMLAAAGPDMVGSITAVAKPPPPGTTRLFFKQEPPANTRSTRGSHLRIFIYQSLADPAVAASSSTSSAASSQAASASSSGMPNLIGLTLEQATSRLTSNMRIGGDEIGTPPPQPEKALTIYVQTPPAGAAIPGTGELVVTVKRYGEARSTSTAEATPYSSSSPGTTTVDDGVTQTAASDDSTSSEETPTATPKKVAKKGSATSGPKRKRPTGPTDATNTVSGQF